MYDLIIIGAGPAGMTAAIYALRQRINILMITKEFGGQVGRKAVTIENYPGLEAIPGPELIRKIKKQAKGKGLKIKLGEVDKIKEKENIFSVVLVNGEEFKGRAVIIASGADPRPLEVPGEKEFIGKGVSYCSVCDGPVFQDKEVAVVGGGNAGFESAIFLSNYVKKIYIIEYVPEVAADKENQEVLEKNKNVKIITNAAVKEIKGDNFVKGIIYKDRKTGEEKEISVEGVFIEIGTQPATSFANGLVEFNERDEIKVEFETYQTKTAGLFAVGDANVGRFKQIITACGEGAVAAQSILNYLQLK